MQEVPACTESTTYWDMPLITDSNASDPDELYQLLVDAHQDLDDETSNQLNAALVLILSNHIDDLDVLQQAVELARSSVAPNES